MYLLGVSAWYHDSAAVLLRDGHIIAAAQEERFTRIKHDPGFPTQAVAFCLMQAGITANELEAVVFYEKPKKKFNRIWNTFLDFAPRGCAAFMEAIPLWLGDKIHQEEKIREGISLSSKLQSSWRGTVLFSEHHLSHAASAFYPSPFKSAAILTIDGVGEWATTSIAVGKQNRIDFQKEIHFPHSLGLLYAAFTTYLGFKVNSGEYKVMGLAPYGRPAYADKIFESLINLNDDGSFTLNLKYFDFCTGKSMTNRAFEELFEGQPRKSESALSQRDMDIASSIQEVTEHIVCRIGSHIAETTGEGNLALAGGVALNCVANGVLSRSKLFENIWIQPAAGDAGGALGAAMAAYHLHFGKPRQVTGKIDAMDGAYLGPAFSTSEIEAALHEQGAHWVSLTEDEMIRRTVNLLVEGKAVGWSQGRMEFGPRSLGGRSILADPRSPFMQKQLNLKVKYRESFRPFAPSVLSEYASKWFEIEVDSPYMLFVARVAEQHHKIREHDSENGIGLGSLYAERTSVPAVTHVDYSARIQTVHKETNPTFYRLIETFYQATGCPILVNTSFNIRGEPIVCSTEEAFNCFMGTDLDVLVVGNCLLMKEEQDKILLTDYRHKHQLD